MYARDPRLLERADSEGPLSEADARLLGELDVDDLGPLLEVAAARRTRLFGGTLTFSPKVFLPLTNLCRNRCDYCSFRRSPGDPGEHTMSPAELEDTFALARSQGVVEALFCLGDTPETGFRDYRALLRSYGHDDTVDYLRWAGERALAHGLLPHTNAGILTLAQMAKLREVNVSLGLMLENVSPRLCEKGMPHHRAPDKRPDKRVAMTREAGQLAIPFTSGLLIGIGETRQERVDTLLAIRALHREHGHIQEVIVQNFRARPEIPMEDAPEPLAREMAHTVALARLILDDDVSLQAPPNLNPADLSLLISSGINDYGGVSPVTPDFINPRHPWPQLEGLAETSARSGFRLEPRMPIYPSYVARPGFLDDALRPHVEAVRARLSTTPAFAASAQLSAGAL